MFSKYYIILNTFAGSPYKFHVDSISSGYVTAYGPGLISGVSGEPSQFTISTKGAGAGGLSMAVEGPSKAEVIVEHLIFNVNVSFKSKYLKGVSSDYI